jgi:sigma-B regulation protein RsbQ
MSAVKRNNVSIRGDGERVIMFVHGFGCDQDMWHLVASNFEADFRVVLLDLVGAGHSDLTSYSAAKYASLEGHADDIIEVCAELDLVDVVFVGHSVSAMIGVIVARKAPHRIGKLVLVGPSPRYIDDDAYVGGFSAHQIEEMLAFLDSNHLGWSAAMAPAIMGNPTRPELSEALADSFCRTDPAIARHFARTTFTSDNRADLPYVTQPTLVLQCREDVIAPVAVGEYVAAMIPDSQLVILDATGHCPNLSAPAETSRAIADFV